MPIIPSFCPVVENQEAKLSVITLLTESNINKSEFEIQKNIWKDKKEWLINFDFEQVMNMSHWREAKIQQNGSIKLPP